MKEPLLQLKGAGLLVLILFLTFSPVLAQDTGAVISGRIVDATDNSPLPGVSIVVKGTATGTQTDGNGQYSITLPPGNTILVFSYIGYLAQEIDVAGRSSVDVLLAIDAAQLDELVVIGYQTVNRKDLTGATSVVSTQNTQRLASRSLPEQLQGLAAGVSVRTGGAPGQEAVVNIRGLGTFGGNANPLYVIDGMFSDPNTTINPNDIETIQILKDASAAAIYGSRAGNGVIIITTKKGKEGPMRVSASAKYGISSIPRTYDMVSGQEYVKINTQAYQNAGYALQPGVATYDGTNTNWKNKTLSTGSIQDYNITLSGGDKNSKVLVSGGYLKDEGTLIGHNFERTSLRINSETGRGRFKISENLSLSSSTRKSPVQGNFEVGNPWYDMFNNLPILPVRGPEYVTPANPSGYSIGSNDARTFSRNPVAINDLWRTQSNFVKIMGNLYFDVEIASFLKYRLNVAGETSFDKHRTVREVGIWYQNQSEKPSSIDDARNQYLSGLAEHTLNFDKAFDQHMVSAVVGYSNQLVRSDGNLASKTNLSSYGGDYFTTINSATGAAGASGFLSKRFLTSYFGRVNYNYAEKYFASFTFRSDKSSVFSPNDRVGLFPSAALGWRIDKEDFFKTEVVSLLKIRATYGVLGIPNADPYQFTGALNQAPRAVFGSDQALYVGGTQGLLVYEDLGWEQKATLNIGIDAAFLNNTVTATLDIFRALTKDVLVQQPIPTYLGGLPDVFPIVNIGEIENRGIELELGYRPKLTGDWQWSANANVSVIRNEIISLGNLGIDPVTGDARNYISSGNTRSQVGRSIGEYYVLQTNGIFQSQEEIDEHGAQADYAQPGDIRYRNLVDGGTGDDITDRDRTFAGSPWPKFTTGIQLNVSYKAFTLSMQWYGAFGQKLYNDVLRDLDGMGYSNYRDGLSYWTPTNTNTGTPRLGVSYSTGLPGDPAVDRGIVSNVRGNSDRWIEDGSFFRLRNLEIGYNLPSTLLNRISMTSARVYVSGQNLLTFTKYSGLDPDVVGANINLEPGVDNGNYPSSRIISVGLNVGF
jgi:TonB-dependent starch-binding outer membrane protein SusC